MNAVCVTFEELAALNARAEKAERQLAQAYADQERLAAGVVKAERQNAAMKSAAKHIYDSLAEFGTADSEWLDGLWKVMDSADAGKSFVPRAVLEKCRETLRWLDRKGGLGLDVHEVIDAALETADEALK